MRMSRRELKPSRHQPPDNPIIVETCKSTWEMYIDGGTPTEGDFIVTVESIEVKPDPDPPVTHTTDITIDHNATAEEIADLLRAIDGLGTVGVSDDDTFTYLADASAPVPAFPYNWIIIQNKLRSGSRITSIHTVTRITLDEGRPRLIRREYS